MVADTSTNNNMNIRGDANEQYPEVPEEAIVKPEDERPLKTTRTAEEISGEDISNTDDSEGTSIDMDGDGNPDWDKST